MPICTSAAPYAAEPSVPSWRWPASKACRRRRFATSTGLATPFLSGAAGQRTSPAIRKLYGIRTMQVRVILVDNRYMRDGRSSRQLGFHAMAMIATAIGAVAVGAFAIGALTLRRLTIRRVLIE